MKPLRPTVLFAAALVLLAACGRGGDDNHTAQNALGGVGQGPAPPAGGGAQQPGNASGNNPQGEVSPSGPGGSNSTAG